MRTFPLPLFGTVIYSLGVLLAFSARAATPASGTVTSMVGSTVSWTGDATATGAANGEGDCVDGVNCDAFELTIAGDPSEYVGKVVAITINWTIPANDYDLVVHKNAVDGPIISTSGNGPPLVGEKAAIRPSDHGTGKYVVHIIYFAGTPQADQPHGTATTQLEQPFRTGVYLKGGGIAFSPSVALKAPVARRDGEPSHRTDFKGNSYVTAIRGVPAGVDLWYIDLNPSSASYDPLMRNPIYRGQPDSFTPQEQESVGADGGGDVDLAVGFGTPAGQTDPTISYSSLVLANVSTGNSLDRGDTFNLNPAGNVAGSPVNDRQWQEFFGDHIVFLTYRTFDPVIGFVQRSTDGGFTFEPGTSLGGVAQNGGIDVDQNDGTVYVSYHDGRVAVGIPATPGAAPSSYTFHQAVIDPNNVSHLFCVVKVASDSTVYVAYSNGKQVFLSHSTDKGATWSLPVRVSDLGEGNNVFPALETGSLSGSVGIAWYGASNQKFNNDLCDWRVYYAYTNNAKDPTPTFTQVEASDHVIHASNISEGGLNGSANRNLIDYFQISFDPLGAAVIAFTDDHNDFTGHTYVTRQIAGPGANGATVALDYPVPAPTPPATPDAAPPAQPGPNGEQVTDFALDAANGSNLVRISAPNPTDILSIKYSSTNSGGKLLFTATMTLSDLTAVPPNATYRMNFTANAPDAVLSASGDNTYGVADRGDQFFVAMTTDAQSTPTYRYGKAVRNPDGSLTYTNIGTADSGSIDQPNKKISVTVDVAKLNDVLSAASRPLIQTGSALVGLRGSASGGQQSDETRGGTLYVIGSVTAKSAVSRKTHGGNKVFDIPLPLFGPAGVECRNGGDTTPNDHQVVVKFYAPVNVAGASSSAGGATASANGDEVTVNLTNVPDKQTITITLQGVNDGLNTADVTIPMTLLAGDTNGDTRVNVADTNETKSSSGSLTTAENFRTDVNLDGRINVADVNFVKNHSGNSIGTQPSRPRITRRK